MTSRRTFITLGAGAVITTLTTCGGGAAVAALPVVKPRVSPPLPPSATPVIDAVDTTGLATGRASPGGQLVLWVDDDELSKVTVTADASGQWSQQFRLANFGTHHINGHAVPTGATVPGLTFTTSAAPVAPSVPPRYGLAAKYPADVGIAADPAVYLAVDPKSPTPWYGFVNPAAFDAVDTDPATGIQRMHMHYVRDPGWNAAGTVWTDGPNPIGSGFSPCVADWYFSKNGRVGPDECYMRYYWSPKADYQCAVQGKKLPGLAGRYGPYGNGGNSTTGRMESDGLSGWSARTLALAGTQATDPIVLSTYLYWADMGTGFGHPLLWNCNPVRPGEVVCIELFAKMNTIDLSQRDARGNGTGRFDGVFTAWVNGVVALDKRDLRFRHHPDIHVDEIWLDHFHGGTEPAEKVHSFWMGGIVAASSYIGPAKAGAAVAGVAGVATVISKNTMRAANQCAAERLNAGLCKWSGSVGLSDSFKSWSSGVWNPDAKTLIVAAGGEGCPGPAMGFNKATGLWETASLISTQVNGTQASDDPTFDKKWYAFADGVAAIGHTYDAVEWVPAAWRITRNKGGFILPVRDVVYKVGSCYRPVICDSTTKQWRKAAGEGPEGISQATSLNTGGGNSCVLDLPNRRYLMIAGATSRLKNDRIATLTFANASGIGVQSRGPLFAPALVPRYPVQIAVPEQRRIVIAGAGEDYTLQLQWYDADALDALHPITWQGDSIYSCAGLGLAWCPWAGCFMAQPCASPTYDWQNQNHVPEYTKPLLEMFRITPDWGGGPWTIARVPVTGAIGYTPTFIGKRLFADESDQTVNWVSSYEGAVYSMKVP